MQPMAPIPTTRATITMSFYVTPDIEKKHAGDAHAVASNIIARALFLLLDGDDAGGPELRFIL